MPLRWKGGPGVMLLPQGGSGASGNPGSAGLIPVLRELQILGFVAQVSMSPGTKGGGHSWCATR